MKKMDDPESVNDSPQEVTMRSYGWVAAASRGPGAGDDGFPDRRRLGVVPVVESLRA